MPLKTLKKKSKKEKIKEDTLLAKQLQDDLPDNDDYYVSPKAFSIKLMEYYDTNVMTDELVTMACNIANRLAYRPNFMNYSYKDEMIGDAKIKIISALVHKKFNPIKAKGNPFSYFTKIAINSFKNRIKKEKKVHETLKAYQEETYGKIISELMPHKQLPYHNNSDYINYNDEN